MTRPPMDLARLGPRTHEGTLTRWALPDPPQADPLQGQSRLRASALSMTHSAEPTSEYPDADGSLAKLRSFKRG